MQFFNFLFVRSHIHLIKEKEVNIIQVPHEGLAQAPRPCGKLNVLAKLLYNTHYP
jgi:hypothetical protein